MKPTAVPPGVPAFEASVAACIAAILEVSVADVPIPPTEHPDPCLVWRNWLAERGLGLVPLQDPLVFGWPGPWIAVLREPDGSGVTAAIAFGNPPGIAWDPLDRGSQLGAIESGYLVAPADVALWSPPVDRLPRRSGRVEVIARAPQAEVAMELVESARLHAGRGLEGDRYFNGTGTFASTHGRGHQVTLIEAESLENLVLPAGRLAAQEARRNIVCRGIDLNPLVGKPFRVGDAICVGRRLCEPCAHLERLTLPGTLRALIHRGGLRADVVEDGLVRVGDEIAEL